MSLQLPRKRTILAWHRWLGIASALFLLSLSVTGLALNHTEFLKLDRIMIHNGLILDRYGMAGGADISAYRINGSNTLAHLDGQLFYNGAPLATGGTPIGIVEGTPITVVATSEQLIYLSENGELIETVGTGQLPYTSLSAIGRSPAGATVLVATEGTWTADADWIEFTPYEGSYSVDALKKIELDPTAEAALLEAFQGGGISLYHVLLDLHSGRFFGWGGRTAMDLTAVAILLLVTSGLSGWLRKSRRKVAPHAR